MLQTVLPLEPLEPLESLESLVREAKDGLSFDRTISRRLVHRASVTEVFLTDAVVAGADRFLIGAQLPRNHALYRPEETGQCDFMLLVETVRQAGIYLSHRHYDVPLGHHFIFKALSLHITDPAALRVGAGPLAVVLDVNVATPGGRTATTPGGRAAAGMPGGAVTGAMTGAIPGAMTGAVSGPTPGAVIGARNPRRFDARFDMVIEVGGRECARASAGVTVIDGVRYARLRQRGRTTGTVPARPSAYETKGGAPGDARGVLRPAPGTAVRQAGTGEWRLHVDPTHPGYFEHPSDHVPGMLLLEAFRQAALELGGGTVLAALEAEFAVFGELGETVTVQAAATTAGDGRMRLSATQGGRVLATAGARRA
ncbi:AfsA-related hotdog domain-containing protein [Streptomyces venezuelae]|uniref:AfsA-related hotdog domain-containing protein n=1 Tax=Streptomyces venezuelae TaxID=54571 RepID=UPI00278BB534|nr:AfsA-related hotdog domain-containing protein [Streptomyces venezuelae]